MRNFKINAFVALAFATLVFSGCDIIEGPKKDYSNIQNQSGKKVLLEDFTGHRCGSCPAAHAEAAAQQAAYGDNIIVVAIHAGGFAVPIPSLGYVNDLRTPYGDALEDEYAVDIAGFPKGLINRREFSGGALTNFSTWGTYIPQVLAEDPLMNIDIASTYSDGTSTADITVDVEYLVGGTYNHNLTVIITEDSVVSMQYNQAATPKDVPNYVQRHVLRTSLSSSTFGESLVNTTIAVGKTYQKSFTYSVPASIKAEHCEVVAFITDASTKEVYQAESHHLK